MSDMTDSHDGYNTVIILSLLFFNWLADATLHDALSNVFLFLSIGFLIYKWLMAFTTHKNKPIDKAHLKEDQDD